MVRRRRSDGARGDTSDERGKDDEREARERRHLGVVGVCCDRESRILASARRNETMHRAHPQLQG